MNSILDLNDSLDAILETKLTFKCPLLSFVLVDAVDTILLGMYRDLMFLF